MMGGAWRARGDAWRSPSAVTRRQGADRKFNLPLSTFNRTEHAIRMARPFPLLSGDGWI
jgi:hypothetical protein